MPKVRLIYGSDWEISYNIDLIGILETPEVVQFQPVITYTEETSPGYPCDFIS